MTDAGSVNEWGPLWAMAGEWHGEGGLDTAFSHSRNEVLGTPYLEKVTMKPFGPVDNGDQHLYGLDYKTAMWRGDESNPFHTEVGYWLWEPKTGVVMQTLAIPRGQVALAGGQAKPDDDRIIVKAERGATEYGICSTAFLEYAFRTDSYQIEVVFNADGTWSYTTDTMLLVHGRDAPFAHRDQNTLTRISDPKPNPWKAILDAKAARG